MRQVKSPFTFERRILGDFEQGIIPVYRVLLGRQVLGWIHYAPKTAKPWCAVEVSKKKARITKTLAHEKTRDMAAYLLLMRHR